MSKELSKKLGFFLGGIVPLIVAVVLFFVSVLPGINAKNVLDNGVEEVGAIFDVDRSGSQVNDEYLYYIEFMFVDSTGIEQIVRSLHNYKISKIRDMGFVEIDYFAGMYTVNVGETVAIMRLGDEAVMKFEKPFNTIVTILFVLFLLAGLTFLTLGALFTFGVIGADKVLKNGKRGQGTYLDRVSGITVNNTQYYRIVFTFEDDDRQIVECKSGNYRESESRAFERMRTFPIRVLGRKAVIDVDKETLIRTQAEINERDARIEQEFEREERRVDIDPFA